MEILTKIKDTISQIPYLGDHLWLLALLPLSLIGLMIWLWLRKRSKPVEQPTDELVDVDELILEEESKEPEKPTVIDERKIAGFFLQLYKAQLGAQKDALSKINLLEAESTADRKTFELQVMQTKGWADRRMSVGPLGSDTTSRSKCYYVIFDQHLVVKVPQKPIHKFQEYLKVIEADQQIVKQLAPRECIVPTVSAVLKLFHPVYTNEDAMPAEVESKYLKLLRKYPGFNEYLKIGNSYVLVMDLAKFYFLSRVIDDFHDLKNKMRQEIVGYPDVVWENHGFEGHYAFENDEQVEAIRNVYAEFEEQLGQLLKSAGHNRTIVRYTMQKWFLEHLSEGQLPPDEKDLNSELVAKVNALARKVFHENKDPIENYRRTIRGCIQSVSVSQNKRQLDSLITNVLDLLAWLRDKEIAIRDLKPDNMVVAGDRARYPEFLSTVDEYSVGLIDVETAVAYGKKGAGKIPQPILGGTPSYATPSHLVKNATLQKLYGNLERALYLQDWYATVGIIYEVITGEVLFRQTGKMIVGIKTALFKNIDDVDTQKELYKKASRIFWHSAQSELQQKISIKEDILNTVQVVILDDARAMLWQEFVNEKVLIAQTIKRYVASQSVFKGEKACSSLISASPEQIAQFKAKWENRSEGKAEALKILNLLERLKTKAAKQMKRIKLFEKSSLMLPADRLLRVLFDIVLDAMHRDHWGDLIAAEVSGIKKDTESTTIESTV